MSSPTLTPSSTASADTVAILDFQDCSNGASTRGILARHQPLTFGRNETSNDHALRRSVHISRNHLEFYSVSFDDTIQPMIYVRDRQSSNGTYVNGVLVGKGPHVTPGRLLEHGDVVTTFMSSWSFTTRLPTADSETLTDIQTLEVKLFGDQYRISNSVIGTGASTRVRVAYDVKTGQQLACKIFDLETMQHSAETEKIMRGLHIMVQLDHPNIACFKRAYRSKHTLYILEEIATGGDLFSLSSRWAPFTELEVRWMMRQILLAVDYLHLKGVVHRDIKQENVLAMVCPQPAHRLALTDFGQADLVGLRRAGGGTRGWQAPELLQKGAYHGQALDMWSVGIMAVRLLCGHHGVMTLSALEDVVAKDPHIKSIDHAGISKEIRAIRCESDTGPGSRDEFIRRCLEPNQYQRMTAAEALKHPWLNESAAMQELFQTRQKQSHGAWTPRRICHQPIGDLHDVLATDEPKQKIDSDNNGFGTNTKTAKESPFANGVYQIRKPTPKNGFDADMAPVKKSPFVNGAYQIRKPPNATSNKEQETMFLVDRKEKGDRLDSESGDERSAKRRKIARDLADGSPL